LETPKFDQFGGASTPTALSARAAELVTRMIELADAVTSK
jgi:hypothetical protein